MRLASAIVVFILLPAVLSAEVVIDGPSVLCEGTTAVLTAPAGMQTYRWNTSETSRSITITAGGTYTVHVRNPQGFPDSGSIEVKSVSKPRPMIGNPLEYICEGDVAILDAPAYYASYLWNTGDTTNSITVAVSGTYSLTVVDTNGCVGTSDATRIVVHPRPRPLINGVNSACRDAEAVYYTELEGGYQYLWSTDGATILEGQGSSAVRVRWTRTGTISVRAIARRPDGGTCDSTVTLFVRVGSRLRPELLYDRSSFCSGDTITLRATPGYASYRWSTGDTTQTIRVFKPGPYWIEVTDSSGCQGASDTLNVREYPRPDVSIDGPLQACEGGETTLTAMDAAEDVVIWEWSTGAKTKSINVNRAGTYTVIGWTLNGCTDTASYILTMAEPIEATISSVDFQVRYVGTTNNAVIIVANEGPIPVSVMEIDLGHVDVSITPSPPRLIPAFSSVTFNVTWIPSTVGVLDLPIGFRLMSSECEQWITSTISGIAIDDDTVGLVAAWLPDTLVHVGSQVEVPLGLQTSLPLGATATATVYMRWDNAVYHFDRVDGTSSVTTVVQGRERRLILTFDLDRNVPNPRIVLNGVAMLTYPFTTPLVIDSVSVASTAPFVISDQDGSLSMTGCWLPGRLVEFVDPNLQVTYYTIEGRKISKADEPHAVCRPCLAVVTDDLGNVVKTYLTNSISR